MAIPRWHASSLGYAVGSQVLVLFSFSLFANGWRARAGVVIAPGCIGGILTNGVEFEHSRSIFYEQPNGQL